MAREIGPKEKALREMREAKQGKTPPPEKPKPKKTSAKRRGKS